MIDLHPVLIAVTATPFFWLCVVPALGWLIAEWLFSRT